MITVLDTNSLWGIIDGDDSHYKQTLSFIRSKKVGELCILATVFMEFRARYNSEFNQLIARLISSIDSQRNETFTLSEINIKISQISNGLSNQSGIDSRKVRGYETDLHKFCADTFKNNAELSRTEIKDSLTSLKNRVDCRIEGSLLLLISVGYEPPEIKEEVEKDIKKKIVEQGIKFEGVADSMIAGQLLSILESNVKENYEFATFDPKFAKKLIEAREKLGIQNLNVTDLQQLSSATSGV